ncbi:unnamed protein product (macronuclear) [Paramecium tetraurelia]|uniref:CRIM domain-containing protein n=1 Tax=Paramecium tetraurelia TaxID=5888 RepID=A0D1X3_PARTE|nr:uncharacterized protein GSPATT00012565001 [Paramecium tetraurelia]CAK77040.1 unnamed protein product [Paramecium tetraurelia]|eukprot:XP_001444437.1 hypothetical protein (macronuclear) [Paramecium tetraurelia strain d4-2]
MKLTKNDAQMHEVNLNLKTQEQQMLYNKKYAFFTLQNDKYVQIICELPNIFTVEDAITFTLSQFQKEIGKFNKNNDLGENFRSKKGSDYVLKISKKSGQPKDDLPCLDNEQILFETGSQTFTLVYKNNQQNSENYQQPQTSVTTTMCSQQESQDMSIKSRASYTNGLNKGKKPIKENDKKEKSGGFCFFNKCF